MNEEEVKFSVVKSRRSSRVRITVKPGGAVVVTVPWLMPKFLGERFLKQNWVWVVKRVREQAKIIPKKRKRLSALDMRRLKLQAKLLVRRRLKQLNEEYGFSFKKIFIRNQKTRWGSCSSSKNLSFNYRIVELPPHLADYLLVHELCHLKEMNHSKRFWDLVGKTVPDFKRWRKELKKYDLG